MASVKFPMNEIVAKVRHARGLLNQDRANLFKILGVQLLSLERKNFQVKSRGGTGDEGLKWKPLKASTIAQKGKRGKRNERRKKTASGKKRPGIGSSQIGVNTGLLRSSSSPGFRGSDGLGGNVLNVKAAEVTVGYGRTYAKHFDEKRPLMPEKLPAKWQQQMDMQTHKWADKITKEVFGGR